MVRCSHSTVWRLEKRMKTKDWICPVDSGFPPLVSFSRSFKDVVMSYFQNFNCFGYQNLLCYMPLVACHQWFVMLQRHILSTRVGRFGFHFFYLWGYDWCTFCSLSSACYRFTFIFLSGVSSSIIDIVRSVLTLPSAGTSQSLISSSPGWPEPLRVWRMRVASGLGASRRGPLIPPALAPVCLASQQVLRGCSPPSLPKKL